MKRGHMKRRQGELLLAIILGLVLTFGLGACGGQNATSAATSEVSAEESSDTTQLDAAALENITVEPAGKPWLNTTWSTSVPAEKPKATDDLYLSVTYDWLKEAKQTGESAAKLLSDTESIKNSLTKAVSDESVKGNGLEQLRIFYQQALDTESLTKQGLEPIKPYTDAIMATKSLDELKDLLVSKDFPFSPWITLGISFADKRETNLAAISPNMLFTKVNLTGGDPYQDSDDPVAQKSAQQALLTGELYASLEAALLVQQGAGDVQVLSSEELQQMVLTMLDFEKSYGKKLDSMSMASKSAYGSLQAETTCTMEELEKAFTNFPIKKLMARYGKDKGDKVVVNDLKWVEPFNALWVDENFEMLRFMTAVKVFNECRTLLDQEPFREVYESLGEVITPEVVAYNACNQLATFSDVVAQNYVENTLGKDAVDRMTKASEDLIATYKDLINNTSWFEDATRSKVLEKLDNMTLNVLYPDGGYYDYSGLKLKTSEEGGTLVSNYLAIKEYRNEQENARIGKPAYANVAWTNIAPTEVNCFYNPSDNSINIYPGYISTANYAKDMKDEAFWAYIATVIGHEISHGFDYLGSQYDAYGRVEPLFAGDDAENFVERRDKLADYYSTIIYDAEGSKVDGVSKCTEAAADLSGMQVVLEYVKSIDGFDYKTFFEAYADQWATTFPPAYSSMVITDTHPFAYLRSNVNAQMFGEFYETFGVKEGDGMYLAPEKRMVIWGESA